MTLRDPTTYTGQPVCPRCGTGWPCCADTKPDGSHYTHQETCAHYNWADNTCGRCTLEIAARTTPPARGRRP